MPRPARSPTPGPNEAENRNAILDAADRQLRRFGPEKITVLDIAREAGMSHPNLYRFFASKADILDAAVARWLEGVETPLAAIAAGPQPASERLRRFMLEQHRIKARKVMEEAEMFRCYGTLIDVAGREAVAAHRARIGALLQGIVADGVASGEFAADTEVAQTAATLKEATNAFHNPMLLPAVMAEGDAAARLDRLMRLLIAGLRR